MMTIGEFAQLTGLTVKALRLYDEHGVLEPACVDPWSRYRRYTAAQLDPAVKLAALRQAGVGLVDMARILARAEPAEAVLDAHRARVAADRRRADAALAVATALLAAEPRDWHVRERAAESQAWVGALVPVGEEVAEDAAIEQVNAAFTTLWRALTAVHNAPTGQCWSAPRVAPDGSASAVECCWPVAGPVPPDWSVPGLAVITGTVAAGPELVVEWRHDDDAPLVEGAVHPAVLALMVEAERRAVEVDLAGLRQIALTEGGDTTGVEVAVPLRRRGTAGPGPVAT